MSELDKPLRTFAESIIVMKSPFSYLPQSCPIDQTDKKRAERRFLSDIRYTLEEQRIKEDEVISKKLCVRAKKSRSAGNSSFQGFRYTCDVFPHLRDFGNTRF